MSEHLTCLLRNMYECQEAIIRAKRRTMEWFQIGKGGCQAVFYHPAYLSYMQST